MGIYLCVSLYVVCPSTHQVARVQGNRHEQAHGQKTRAKVIEADLGALAVKAKHLAIHVCSDGGKAHTQCAESHWVAESIIREDVFIEENQR